jgi:hypothetical protein
MIRARVGAHQRESGMAQAVEELRKFEGRQVSVAVADGSRIDDCSLVSAGRGRADTVWVFVNGGDIFIRLADVVAVWEAQNPSAEGFQRGRSAA